jgi:exodeoxyribonuclease VII large subunit
VIRFTLRLSKNYMEHERPVWGVTELNVYIKELFEIDYRLQDIEVFGEISNFTTARSGHLYFTLKDKKSQIRCVMWKTMTTGLRYRPKDGDAVLVHGRISVYEAAGQYQLYADSIVPEGRGDLFLAFEQLKEQLEGEGLFDQDQKKSLPVIPEKIGIVTSQDGAALRDILNVLRRRWPLTSVLVAPTLVQGDDAPEQIIDAIKWLDGRDDVDLIIVARGGGSIEDLWAFNDEAMARTIFAVDTPIIAGVGHQTDFTIADFVADVRAPTPSSAAELSVPNIDDYLSWIRQQKVASGFAINTILDHLQRQLENSARALRHLSPSAKLDASRQRVDWLAERLDRNLSSVLDSKQSRLTIADTALQTVNPIATLSRGYAIVRHDPGGVVKKVSDVVNGDVLSIQVSDGEFSARVESNK